MSDFLTLSTSISASALIDQKLAIHFKVPWLLEEIVPIRSLSVSKPLLLALVPSSWTVFSCRYPFSDCSNRFFSSFGRLRYTLLRLFFKFPPSVVPFSFRIVLRYRFLSSFGRLRYSSLRLFFKFLSFGPSIDIVLRYRFLLRSSTVHVATSLFQVF